MRAANGGSLRLVLTDAASGARRSLGRDGGTTPPSRTEEQPQVEEINIGPSSFYIGECLRGLMASGRPVLQFSAWGVKPKITGLSLDKYRKNSGPMPGRNCRQICAASGRYLPPDAPSKPSWPSVLKVQLSKPRGSLANYFNRILMLCPSRTRRAAGQT